MRFTQGFFFCYFFFFDEFAALDLSRMSSLAGHDGCTWGFATTFVIGGYHFAFALHSIIAQNKSHFAFAQPIFDDAIYSHPFFSPSAEDNITCNRVYGYSNYLGSVRGSSDESGGQGLHTWHLCARER